MGSKWKTMGSVPGVPYCCKKCGKNDPSYSTAHSVVDGLIAGVTATSQDLASGAKSYINNGTRPNNIGKGTYIKNCNQEIQTIESFSSKSEKILGKLGTALTIVTTVNDMATGAYNNWQNGAGIGKIGYDMLVDGVMTGGTIWASGMIGGAIGSCVPVVGNIVGAVIGFGVGMALSWAVDEWKPNGQTIRDNLKGVVA